MALCETLWTDGRPSELKITDGDHLWSVWKLTVVDALRFIDGQWNKTEKVVRN